jgi:hypothetical protein
MTHLALNRASRVVLSLGGLLALSASTVAADDPGSPAFFEAKIRPVLVERCYECHGSAHTAPKGGLRLDSRDGLLQGGVSGPALVPGEPDESPLIQAIARTGDVAPMPPKSASALPAPVVADFRRWVGRGAFDPRTGAATVAKPAAPRSDWWSLRPLHRPPVPVLSGGDAVRACMPIDAFLLARLRPKGLVPSPEANRRTLIRRVSFDLTGLPPTPEEVAVFERDASPNAYESLVDRLLASPRYGERWARHWLDVIHFADTHGFEHDLLRPNAWRYRDYVIDRLNRDIPWSCFIREQLAADVFFPDEPRFTAALGFLGAGPYDQSAAATAPRTFEYLDRDDLVTQTTAAFVSTTASCARCHAHKFDPITQEDYYALQAVFAGVGKGDVPYDDDPAVARARRHWQSVLAASDRGEADVLLTPGNLPHLDLWESARAAMGSWQRLEAEVFVSSNGSILRRQADGSLTASGTRPDTDAYRVTVAPAPGEITALRLDVLADPSLPFKGPGRMDNGNFHLSELEVLLVKPGAAGPERLKIRHATADWNQPDWGVARAIDGDVKTAWGIYPKVGASHHAVFELEPTLTVRPGDRVVVVLRQLHGAGHLIGRFRLSATSAPPGAAIALSAEAEAAFATPRDRRTPAQHFALGLPVLRWHAENELARLPAPVKVYAAARTSENDRGVVTIDPPRIIHVLKRGDLGSPGPKVGPGALSAVTALKARFDGLPAGNEAARRAALADWIADPNNPLTWRSAANRVWHFHFGRGLCDTPSDFGRMGGVLSHPELLDWLAVELRDHGGSLKHLHRLICNSAAYRQTSAHRADAAAIDPDNRLLWRMNRPRLDADAFRDAVLAVSGRLDLTVGGPGVSHFKSSPGPQLTPVLDYGAFDWDTPGAERRSIYRVVWRGISDPLMEALDFPDAAMLTPVRGFSASPLQALTLLNNSFVLRHCDHLAARLQSLGTTTRDRVCAAFRLVLLREPTAPELAGFVELADRRALAAACRVLLNSNEFLFVD